MATWSDSEVLHLIELWGEEGVQEQLEGAKRNKHVYEKIAKGMRERGSDKTGVQCRAKMKKLKLDYRKIKDTHGKTGRGRSTWKFFNKLDAVLGHKPATRPPVVLDTSEDPAGRNESDDGAEVEDDDLSPVDNSFSSSTTTTTTTNTTITTTTVTASNTSATNAEDGASNQHLAQASKEAPSTSGIKGKRKKRTRDERIESALRTVVNDVVEAQQKSDQLFLEWEEKRMRFEAEQRKEEREFQLRMMSMLFGGQSSRSFQSPHPAYNDYEQLDDYDV